MKTTIKIRLFAIIVLMATIAVSNPYDANAQRRDSRTNKQKEDIRGYKSYEKKRNDHHRNDREDHKIRSFSDSRRYGDARQNDKIRRDKNKSNSHYDSNRRKHDNHNFHSDWDKHKKSKYKKHYDLNFGHKHHNDYYYHPKYGKTYRKFYKTPFVLRHNQGRYFYYDGYFCNYRPGIGYVVIDIPYMTIFPRLPFHCKRVRIHGNIYYRYGNLYFESLPYGYRLIPSPLHIHISAQF